MSASETVDVDIVPAEPAPAPAPVLPFPKAKPGAAPARAPDEGFSPQPEDTRPSFGQSGALGRSQPHSIEAEENVLSLCSLDGADVVERCIEARIGPESFYDPKHAIIFERFLDLYHRRAPSMDPAIVAEELKTSRQLDAIGGYPFLAQVTSRIPTTIQAGMWIEKVREHALLRELIRTANGIVEDCYNFTGGIDEFAARQAERFELLAGRESSGTTAALLARAIAAEINPAKPPPPDRPIFYIGEKVISTSGNLTVIGGRAKTAKTAVISAAQSACIVASGLGDPDADTLGIRSSPPEGHAVISIDTEQSPAHAADNLSRGALTRAGVEPTAKPEWLHHYALAGWTARELAAVLPAIVKSAAKAHGGVHAVLIDGGADFTTDVNDADTASELCAAWHALAIEYGCAIVIVIHSNEGRQSDDIARGWLGKQLRRKAESNLTLKRDGEVIVLYGDDGQRGAPIFEREGPRFSWDSAAGMHTSCESRVSVETAELRDLAEEVFSGNHLRYAEACEKIGKARRVGDKASEKWFTRMKKANVIRNIGFGLWEVMAA